MTNVTEEILIRGRVVTAELIYVSGRGDYRVYKYRGKIYRVMTKPEEPCCRHSTEEDSQLSRENGYHEHPKQQD